MLFAKLKNFFKKQPSTFKRGNFTHILIIIWGGKKKKKNYVQGFYEYLFLYFNFLKYTFYFSTDFFVSFLLFF